MANRLKMAAVDSIYTLLERGYSHNSCAISVQNRCGRPVPGVLAFRPMGLALHHSFTVRLIPSWEQSPVISSRIGAEGIAMVPAATWLC